MRGQSLRRCRWSKWRRSIYRLWSDGGCMPSWLSERRHSWWLNQRKVMRRKSSLTAWEWVAALWGWWPSCRVGPRIKARWWRRILSGCRNNHSEAIEMYNLGVEYRLVLLLWNQVGIRSFLKWTGVLHQGMIVFPHDRWLKCLVPWEVLYLHHIRKVLYIKL